MSKPENRETIAVDIDDVLAAHIESFIEFSNSQYGTALTPDKYSEKWSILWGIEHDEMEERVLKFHTPEIVGNFGVIEDAELALRSLKKSRDLVVVTARPARIIEATNHWLEQNFADVFTDVHFVPIWQPDNKVSKADICRNIGADYLIDDLIRHCNIAAESGIKALLFRRAKWEQTEELHPDVTSVGDWREVLEYFDEQS